MWSDSNSEDCGYLIYTFKRDAQTSEFIAEELVYNCPEALRSILGYVYAHDSMVKTFVWTAPYSIDIHRHLKEPRIEAKVSMGMMFRAVDVEAVLIHLADSYDGHEIGIAVIDDFADWNTDVYRISPGCVERCNSGSQPLEAFTADVEMSIQHFSQACCGYTSVTSLASDKLVKVYRANAIPTLDRFFIYGITYVPHMNDFF